MKKKIIQYALLIITLICNAYAQSTNQIKDPLYDYCKDYLSYVDTTPEQAAESVKNSDAPYSYCYNSKSQFYYFQADLTGDGNKTYFITDEGAYCPLSKGNYTWVIYYPVKNGCYLKTAAYKNGNPIEFGYGGPGYVGYVSLIKKLGFISGGKHYLEIGYFDRDGISSVSYEDNTKEYEDLLTKNLTEQNRKKPILTTNSLSELVQMYGH